jgi:hypothetical protein
VKRIAPEPVRNGTSFAWHRRRVVFVLAPTSCLFAAGAANLLIGGAAFETAKRMNPKDRIEYRRGGAMVPAKSGQDNKV